jgi:hypothetical protein
MLAKGSALASRRKSRYSRRVAMPLAVKERRERHQSAPAVRGLTDDRSGHCKGPAETTRMLASEQDIIRDLLKRGQTSINSKASGDFHKPSGFTTRKETLRRPGLSRSRLHRSVKKSAVFFTHSFLIGCPCDFASMDRGPAVSALKAESLRRSARMWDL